MLLMGERGKAKRVPRGTLKRLLFGYTAECAKVDVLPQEDERPAADDAPEPVPEPDPEGNETAETG
ncbi:MAG: hypothetical protein ACPLPR_03755 [Bacillota bacterium]